MDKRFEKIYEIAEREGWQVDYSYTDEKETDVIFSFEKYGIIIKTSFAKVNSWLHNSISLS